MAVLWVLCPACRRGYGVPTLLLRAAGGDAMPPAAWLDTHCGAWLDMDPAGPGRMRRVWLKQSAVPQLSEWTDARPAQHHHRRGRSHSSRSRRCSSERDQGNAAAASRGTAVCGPGLAHGSLAAEVEEGEEDYIQRLHAFLQRQPQGCGMLDLARWAPCVTWVRHSLFV